MMAVVTVATLDGSTTVSAGGQMNTMPRSDGCRCRASWMIVVLAGDDVVGKLDHVVHGIPLLDSGDLSPAGVSALVGPLVWTC
jgi:hypothetical protein